MKKLKDSEVIYHALIWGEENIAAMLEATRDSADPEYRAELERLIKAMRKYRERKYGRQNDPLEGTVLVDALSGLPVSKTLFLPNTQNKKD